MVDETREKTNEYSETYVGFTRDDGTKVPVQVIECQGPRTGPTTAVVRFLSNSVEQVPIEMLDFRFPPLGMINTKRGLAFYVWRTPNARQWKRGLRSLVLMSHTVTPCPLPGTDNFFTEDALEFMYNPKYPTYQEALEKLHKSEAISLGLSPDFWVSIHPSLKGLSLGYRRWYIGVVEDDSTPRIFNSQERLKTLWEEQVNAGNN